MSIAVASDKVAIRTRNDGQWKKYTYQDSTFTVTLSGLLVFDVANWTGWDMLDNQLNFSHILFRCSFDDEEGNVRTVQGYCMIETSTLGYSTGTLVKNDFALQGNGKIDMFDGLIPCPSVINTITVTGQTAGDGIIHLAYTYTGDVYQVKYRIDNTGDYAFAQVDMPIAIPGLATGSHSVEIIPVCVNGYEGTGMTQAFNVTQSLTCTSAITSITVSTGAGAAATNTHTGAATQMKYRIDGGLWFNSPIDTPISVSALSAGAHTIEEVPICANALEGTGLVQPFTIVSQPSQSVINWNFTYSPVRFFTPIFNIYVNGVLTISRTGTSSGSFVVPIGQSVKATLSASAAGRPGAAIVAGLSIIDTTTSGVVTNQSQTALTVALNFTFVPSGDTFTITETIT